MTFESDTRSEVFAILKRQGITPISVRERKNIGTHAGPFQSSRYIVVGLSIGIIAVATIGYLLLVPSQNEFVSVEVSQIPQKVPQKREDPKPAEMVTDEKTVVIDVPSFTVPAQTSKEPKQSVAGAVPRQQLRGTQARIERALQAGQRRIFKHDAECYLSNFAIPGEQVPPTPYDKDMIADLLKALEDPIIVDEDSDTAEDVQMKSIVQGMKDEIKEYLRNGGTITQYLDELQKRQDREADYYSEAFQMVNTYTKENSPAEAYELWKRTNRHLEEKGIRTMPLPRRLRKYAESQNQD